MLKGRPHTASILLVLLLVGLAAAILAHEMRSFTFADIARSVAAISWNRIGQSVALTSVSFVALGAYDVLATRLVAPGRVPAGLAWFAGAAGNAIANTLGFHAVTGPAVRYRLYSAVGLTLPDIARVISLSWTALGFGFIAVFGLTALFQIQESPVARIGGAGMLALMALLLLWLARRGGRAVSVGSLSLPLPSARMAALQMTIAAVEMAAAIGALYVLMPSGGAPSFLNFSAIYVGAVLLGIVSHAPGGIGIFEAAILSFSAGHDRSGALAALLLYRLIYNFLPFAVTTTVLVVFEATRRKVNSRADNAG